MKTNNLFKGIFIIALLAIVYFISVSQNCSKQSICKPDKNDGYDYSSQSRYAMLSSGEKTRLYITTYANCAYKISVCSEANLGKLHFKLFEKVREKKKIIKDLIKGEAPVITDANGNISTGEAAVIDTVYDVQVNLKEVEIYDSSSGSEFWQINKVDKTKNLVLELYIPKTAEPTNGCVNLMVGTKRPAKSYMGKLKE
mgnify:FL=1